MRIPRKLLLALPVVFLLYFYGLDGMGLVGPDEPRYAAIGQEMARSGDWITPRLWGQPWFEKPALLYWMIAAGARAGLDSDLAPRVPVALLSVWFLVLYFLRMRREFGERAAWFASAMLATSAGWLTFSHVAVTDIPLAATFSASMLLALPWVRSGGRRGLLISAALLGLAILAKGLVPLVLALPLFWIGRRRWKDLLMFAAVAITVAAPWYVLCYLRNGWEFVQVFFIQHHFSRFVSDELQHVQPVWFYVPVFAGLLFPWIPLLAVIHRTDWREPRQYLLLLWLTFGFVFFSVSTNKLPGYVLPLLPAATALAGIQLASAPIRWVLPLSVLSLALVPVAGSVLPAAIASGLSRADAQPIPWLVVGLTVAVAGVVWRLQRQNSSVAFDVSAAAAAASMLWLIATAFPAIDRVASARPRWRESTPSCVANPTRNVRYGLNYYAGRELPECPDRLP